MRWLESQTISVCGQVRRHVMLNRDPHHRGLLDMVARHSLGTDVILWVCCGTRCGFVVCTSLHEQYLDEKDSEAVQQERVLHQRRMKSQNNCQDRVLG